MITRQAFDASGHLSSRILLGAAAFSDVTQAETDAALELALSLGVNHIDVAASYGEADSEVGSTGTASSSSLPRKQGTHSRKRC